MKEHRREFKKLVDKLKNENVLKQLKTNSVEETEKAWKRIVARYRNACISWKNKYYETIESNWIYPRDKKLKQNDFPIEICILIRIMNDSDERQIHDKEVFNEIGVLHDCLFETKELPGILLAGTLDDGLSISSMPRDLFLEIFVN